MDVSNSGSGQGLLGRRPLGGSAQHIRQKHVVTDNMTDAISLIQEAKVELTFHLLCLGVSKVMYILRARGGEPKICKELVN